MQYKDYYQILNLNRDASTEDIHKAYRRLARKYHPDLNKSKDAESKFKEINEAHEVLADPQKRSRYDQLGANWQAGQDFQPPPDFRDFFRFHSRPRGGGKQANNMFGSGAGPDFGLGGFSDFFNAIFGGEMFNGSAGENDDAMARDAERRGAPGETLLEITISLQEALKGTARQIVVKDGRGHEKSYKVKIPAGITDHSTIRFRPEMQKAEGHLADVRIRIKIAESAGFTLVGDDIFMRLPISPWEAVLGSKIKLQLADSAYQVSIPAGSQNGQKLRLKGKGFFSKGHAGDLIVELIIQVPSKSQKAELDLYQQLKQVSNFNPRG